MGATIKLLADAETSGLNLNKDLTIDGNGHALKFTDKGIALWGHALVLKNVNASMAGVGSTPYTAEWKWMSVCASKDASLTLDGATLTMDGTGTASNVHAIYFCSNNKLNLKNGSNLTIKNYKQDALEWDGGDTSKAALPTPPITAALALRVRLSSRLTTRRSTS